jgi:hypothetical protein
MDHLTYLVGPGSSAGPRQVDRLLTANLTAKGAAQGGIGRPVADDEGRELTAREHESCWSGGVAYGD